MTPIATKPYVPKPDEIVPLGVAVKVYPPAPEPVGVPLFVRSSHSGWASDGWNGLGGPANLTDTRTTFSFHVPFARFAL